MPKVEILNEVIIIHCQDSFATHLLEADTEEKK